MNNNPSLLMAVVAFMAGAIVGSYVNTCVYRIPRGISTVKPRSACPGCGAALRPAELIPLISYAVLRGRCSRCRMRINPRYPLVEFVCGILWLSLSLRFGLSFEFICYAVLCSALLAAFFIDIEWMRIPNALTIFAMIPALSAYVRYAFFLSPAARLVSLYESLGVAEPLLGLIPASLFFAIYLASASMGKGKAAIGMGDVKLLVPVGLALGMRQGLFAAFVAVALGGITGIVLLASGIKNRKDPIPFGPFIVVGTYAAVFIPLSALYGVLSF